MFLVGGGFVEKASWIIMLVNLSSWSIPTFFLFSFFFLDGGFRVKIAEP